MLIALYIFLATVAILLLIFCFYLLHDFFETKRLEMDRAKGKGSAPDDDAHFSAKDYIGEEHEWSPVFKLEHRGLRLFNLPFIPEENEIIYLENEYDADANKFVKENIRLIRERLATRGFTFVYLPELKISKELVESMIMYRTPQSHSDIHPDIDEQITLPSNFLLDYMIHPENRKNIRSSFAWYGHKHVLFEQRKTWSYFNYITFDAQEALADPLGVINDMLPELGTKKRFKEGSYSMQKPNESDKGSADYNFDEETKKILEDIQQKLDAIRLKGIGEAIITRYIKPRPVLSHIRITHDFRIFLDDYNNMEITMEPLVKAVYLLFLRHEEGIAFKELSDYAVELETIYRAIKAKSNDIDEKLASRLYYPSISESVKKLVNPLDNSINEKCTRVKEAFIIHFHESIAEHYYIQGARQSNKQIFLPRNLIIWEDKQ